MPIIEIKNLNYIYGAGTPFEKKALDSVSLTIEKGEFIGIIGHTGSGKSTLVQHLNGLLKPDSGSVLLNGQDIFKEQKKIRDIRFKVGLVFQYPEYQLFEETVYKDIAYGPSNRKVSGSELEARVCEAARFVGLQENLLQKSPFDLSGGEKRRAAIAGVIAMRPEVLVLDEPTAGLDPRGRDEILTQVQKYRRESGTTVILVSHSMEDVASFADRVLVMNGGRAEMFDTVKNVFRRADELEKMGLQVPQITQVFLRLASLGVPVDTGIYSFSGGLAEAGKLLNGGAEK